MRTAGLTIPYRVRTYLQLGLSIGIPACDSSAHDHLSSSEYADFSLAVVDRIELEETEKAPLGDIGTLSVAANGDLLVGDRLIPRVRRYDRAGRLVAQFGSFGEGPYEFQRVGGVLEDKTGRVLVVDPGLGRVTVLNADLQPDTILRVRPPPLGPLLRLPEGGFLIKTLAGRRTTGFSLMSEEWVPIWQIPAPVPRSAQENPYWSSYASTEFAASADAIVIAYSFQYPLQLYSHSGVPTIAFGEQPPSFRSAPILRAGALAGPDATERRATWLASFNVIANLAVTEDSLLAVTHGIHRVLDGTGRRVQDHQSVDFYRLPSGVKIAEDVGLPPGSRVITGHLDGLYAVSSSPPDPWTISVLQITR